MAQLNGSQIPKTQTAAVVTELGGKIQFIDDYPVPEIGDREVLAKILYTGVCQSGKCFIASGCTV